MSLRPSFIFDPRIHWVDARLLDRSAPVKARRQGRAPPCVHGCRVLSRRSPIEVELQAHALERLYGARNVELQEMYRWTGTASMSGA